MKKQFLNTIKACAVIALALPLMANQSCEQQPQAARKLKRRIGFIDPMNAIKANDFMLPGGLVTNLGPRMSGQLLEELVGTKNPDFYISQEMPRLSADGMNLMAVDTTPACVRDYPMMLLMGSVPYYEFVGSGSVSFGYSKSGDFGNISVTPTIKVDVAQMELNLFAGDPLTGKLNGGGKATSNDTKVSVNATINFNDFVVTPTYYKTTGLAKVAEKAIQKSLSKLAVDAAKIPWEVQVTEDDDRFIIINAGSNAGLQADDVLTVHNQIYKWKDNGEACKVPLAFKADQRDTPTAIIKLKTVMPEYSISYPDPERPNDENVQVGAVVRLKEFASVPKQ